MKIMVVDDEDIIIALLAEHLKEMGFNDVTTASSGEEALEVIAARDDPFDCFLLDIKMGGMDGIELCSRIREMAEYRIAPIIMITSAAAKQHMHEAFDAGATDYMMKPIEQIDLRVRIQIAMLLVETLKSEAESRSALTAALRTSPEARQFDPSMRITYSGVPNMRDYFQLENRLLRLSEGTYAMTLLSIEIDGIEKLGARLGQGDFWILLRQWQRSSGRPFRPAVPHFPMWGSASSSASSWCATISCRTCCRRVSGTRSGPMRPRTMYCRPANWN